MPRESMQGDHFDLLPFISILLCVLGCLMLVTMSMSALSLGVGAGEGWIPAAGIKTDKKPVLVEWDGSQIVVHDKNQRRRVTFMDETERVLRMADGSEYKVAVRGKINPQFTSIVDEFAKSADRYALFAVRPSGFRNFDLMADEFRERKIAVGYEPIDQSRPVRLVEEAINGKNQNPK